MMAKNRIKVFFSIDTNGLKIAMLIVWLVLSTVVLLILISPFLLSQNTLFALSRLCELNHVPHIESPLFGMTRAFIDISRGEIRPAAQLNKGSAYLYGIFLLNEFILFGFLVYKLTNKRRSNYAST